jgi:ABC-2 type transport system permease protein
MKEMLILTKTLLNANFGFSKFIHDAKTDKKKLGMALLLILVFASLIPVYNMYIKLLNTVYIQLFVLGQEGAIFAMTFSAAAIVVLFFGLIYAMSTFYFSKDLDKLLFLPIKEETIVSAKFINMVVYEYMIVVPILAPVFFIPFEDMGGVLYALFFAIGVLLLPVIPLSIGTVIVMFIMKFVNIEGKKDILRTVSLFLFLVIIILFQFLVNRAATAIPPGSEGEYIEALLRNQNSLVNIVGRTYPPAIWLSKGLYESNTASGIISFLLYGAASVVFGLGVVVAGKKLYVQGYFNKSDSVKKHIALEYDKDVVASSPWKAIFLNDMKMVLRTPIYLFNCVSIVVIIPVIMILMPLISGGGELDMFTELYRDFKDIFTFLLIGIFVFIAGTNPTQSTTVSREGKASWVNAVVPVSKRDAFMGRMIFPIILQTTAMMFFLVPLIFILKLEVSTVAFALIGGLASSVPVIGFGVLVDTYRPKLDWDDPQKAVKQNLNVLFNMLAAIAFGAAMGFAIYFLFNVAGLSVEVLVGILIVASTLMTALVYSLYNRIN